MSLKKVHRSLKVEIDPSNRVRGLLYQHSGAHRFAWNWALARRKELFVTKGGYVMSVYVYEGHSYVCAGCAELIRQEEPLASILGPFTLEQGIPWDGPVHCYCRYLCVNAIPLKEGEVVKTGEEGRGNQWGAFLENKPLKPEALKALRYSFTDPVRGGTKRSNINKIYQAFYGI